MKIIYANSHPTFEYAAWEMKKILDRMTKVYDYGTVCKTDVLPATAGEGEILLGLSSEFGRDCSEAVDPSIDDLEDVEIRNGSGIIAGSNPRSVLFGVYDFFKSMGCMWVRPGPKGEFLTDKDPSKHTFVYKKLADIQFRGECLEGSPNYEHLRATVEWAPKVHMNMFMLEQICPYNYMSRWFRHEGNTYLPNEDIGYEGCVGLISLLEKDIIKTGLQFHALGHGYQVEPYGIHFQTSFQPYTMNPKMERALAKINGKREFFGGSPFWSQLCMSNQEVIDEQVQWLADYAEKKPYIDFLHVWLGDACNNHCECEECVKHLPSDLYVRMLNQLDEELTRRGINTRIVFISYTDTSWAPIEEVIHNPKRFILCSAVGNRDYSKPYDDTETDAPIPTWVRNNAPKRSGLPMTRKMLREWERAYKGPNFIYEYIFYSDHYNDPGLMDLAKNYYYSLRQVLSLGFGGIMSDQTQRCAFPIALPCMMTGETQFDLYRPLDEVTVNYFKAAFGARWASVLDYLKEISKRFCPASLRTQLSADLNSVSAQGTDKVYYRNNPKAAERFAAIPAFVDGFLPEILAGEKSENECHARSFKILEYHAEYCKMYAEVFRLGALDDMDGARAAYAKMKDRMSVIEPAIQYEFEIALFDQTMCGKLEIRK